LLAAVRVAAAHGSRGKGTLVVMDDRIISARDAQKVYARTGGFTAPEMGVIGVVARHGVEYFYTPARKHSSASEFDVREVASLPRVDIQYSYAGAEGRREKPKPKPSSLRRRIECRRTRILRRPRPAGSHDRDDVSFRRPGCLAEHSRDAFPAIAVQRMLPTHARILMMLALTKTRTYARSNVFSISTDMDIHILALGAITIRGLRTRFRLARHAIRTRNCLSIGF
jgi:hypothetical protein